MNAWQMLKKTAKEFFDNDGSVYGASISYYTLFSIGPLITIVIWIMGLFFQQEAINGQIYSLLQNMIDEKVAKLVQDIVLNASIEKKHGIWATIFGIIVTIYSATYIVVQMKEMLDKIWKIKKPEETASLAKKYLIGVIGIFGIGVILLISGLLSAVAAVLGESLFLILPFTKDILKVVNNLAVFILVSIFIAAMFKYLPNLKLSWKAVIPGALFTTALFFIGKILFGWYMSTQMLDSTYGAASSLVVFIMWVYFSAQVIFFGAEFTQVYAVEKKLVIR